MLRSHQHHLLWNLLLQCLSQLWYWMTWLCQWILPVLTLILQVILIGLPTSTKRPASLGQPTTFPTVLPSVIKVDWYPACLLELSGFPQKAADHRNLGVPLYTTFVVYFMDHRRPNILNQRTIKDWRKPKSLYSEPSETISLNCLTKIRSHFQTVKLLRTFFCCEGWIRTNDPKVMSLVSYLCSTPQYSEKIYYV